MLCLYSKQIQTKDRIAYHWPIIPDNVFTREALELFGLIKEKLIELQIEPYEARKYFRQFTQKIQEIGLIPPLILNLLRDIRGNYQTLIISQNLSPEEERIIAACLLPTIAASNEIAPQTSSTSLANIKREIVFSDSPFSDLLNDIYSVVLNCVGNTSYAQRFTNQVNDALKNLTRPPLPAVLHFRHIIGLLSEQLNPQVNRNGILRYLKTQALFRLCQKT